MRPLRGWRAAVAVAAVVLVAGGCGSGAGSGDDDGLRRLPAGSAAGGASGGAESSATMAADVAVDSDASARMIAPVRAVEYRLADDASSAPTKAEAYQLKARSSDEVQAKIAKALDVDADLVEVGAGGYDWSYSRVGPDSAVSSSAVATSPACVPDEKCIQADPGEETPSLPETTVPGVPTADDAEDRVRDLLSALGASDDGSLETFGGPGTDGTTVMFTASVGGIPVPAFTTQVVFGENGRVEYANGVIAEVEAIGEYPLVGLREAVERLQNGFGAGGNIASLGVAEDLVARSGATAEAVPDAHPAGDAETAEREGPTAGGSAAGSTGSSGSGSAGSCAPDEPCSTPPSPPADEPPMTIEPQPAEPIEPPEPQIVEITGADIGLELVAAGCPGDPVYLVPTFDLRSDDGSVGSVIAVEDDLIAGAGGDAADIEPCPGDGRGDVPMGKPEPAPLPPDAGSVEPQPAPAPAPDVAPTAKP